MEKHAEIEKLQKKFGEAAERDNLGRRDKNEKGGEYESSDSEDENNNYNGGNGPAGRGGQKYHPRDGTQENMKWSDRDQPDNQ